MINYTQNEEYHYFAFISYATSDSKWAKWLQHNLSYYHIPSSVKKSRIGIPQNIRPIFIYEYDLSGNQLHTAIERELISSKYLIVICSPSSAKSKYVNNEVQMFIDRGKANLIIPFIIDGEINSADPNKECFPPALRKLLNESVLQDEIRGISIATNGKRHALVDVVATMLNVRRDILWNRYNIRRIQHNIVLGVLSFLVLLLCLFCWDYRRIKVRYYADYVDKFGIAEGVIPINNEELSHRNRTYKFEFKRTPFGIDNAYKWRLHRMSYVNSQGTPQAYNNSEQMDRFSIVEYTYDKDGKLLKTINMNSDNIMLSEYHYSDDGDCENCIIDIVAPNTRNSIAFTSANTSIMDYQNNSIEKNTISRYILRRDYDGVITQKTFHSDNRPNYRLSRTCDFDDVSGYIYKNDSLGRVIGITVLDKKDKPTNKRYGYAQKEYYYKNNNLDSLVYKSKEGRLTRNERNWAIAVMNHDAWGNCTLEKYYDENLKACYREWQMAQLRAIYNDCGECIRIDFLSEDGRLKINTNLGYASIYREYDDRGNQTLESYHDPKGWNATSNQWGASKLKLKYDKHNRRVEISTHDVHGNLCLGLNEAAINRMTYYENGLLKESTCYDTMGEPINNKDGFHKIEYVYNKLGYLSETRYFNEKNILCKNVHGIAIIKNSFDKQGNVRESAFFDEYSNPTKETSINLAQKCVYVYDDYGRRVSFSLYDEDTKILGKDKWHKETYEYGANGLVSKYTYYNTRDSLCRTSLGFSSSLYKYNSFGKPISITNYDNDNILNIVEMDYNERGMITYWGIRDEHERIETADGYSSVIYKYDLLGNQVLAEYRDKNNRLCVNKTLKYAVFEAKYNDYGFLTYMAFYDHNKNLIKVDNYAPLYKATYNGDKLQEVVLYDEDGKSLFMGDNGYARRVIEYDDKGLTLTDSFYDSDDELVVACLGFASCRFIYDKNDNQVGIKFYNEKMKEIQIQ